MGPYTAANMIGDDKKPNFWLNIERQGPHIHERRSNLILNDQRNHVWSSHFSVIAQATEREREKTKTL